MTRFFRTPKGLLTIVFAILLAVAVPSAHAAAGIPGLLSAIAASMAVDAVILRYRNGGWEFPSGALLTAAIVGMILSPREPWYVTTVTSLIGIFSKYLARVKTANVFNPAALGLVATFYVFNPAQNWWGALADANWLGVILLVATGAFITDRVNKAPMVLSFLGVYFALFTVTSFVLDAARFVEIFRSPDLQAVLYFAFFIVSDPPTTPVKYPHQIVCGIVVAVTSFAIFEWVGGAYYLLAGVLVGNAWEAARRLR